MFDIIIPVVASDVGTLRKNLKYIRKNLDGKKVIAIGNAEVQKALDEDDCRHIVFEDEDSLFPGMKLAEIKKILLQRGGDPKRAGWYFQQFLKIAYAYKCPDEYYLSWDSDTVPAQPVNMFENGIPVFDMKAEYHLPYFATIERLFNGRISKQSPSSFISEHMLFSAKYVKEMAADIESNAQLQGNAFWEKILWAIDIADISKSGFSEFETYGNYVCKTHPGQYIYRKKESLRFGAYFLGYNWTDEMIIWASKDYALISFEKNTTPPQWLPKLTNMIAGSFLKYIIRLKWVKIVYYKLTGLCKRIRGKRY